MLRYTLRYARTYVHRSERTSTHDRRSRGRFARRLKGLLAEEDALPEVNGFCQDTFFAARLRAGKLSAELPRWASPPSPGRTRTPLFA